MGDRRDCWVESDLFMIGSDGGWLVMVEDG